jgi:hypothetical protein
LLICCGLDVTITHLTKLRKTYWETVLENVLENVLGKMYRGTISKGLSFLLLILDYSPSLLSPPLLSFFIPLLS